MKTITYEDFVGVEPCWLTDDDKREKHAECNFGVDCAFKAYPMQYECCNYGCFLNHEGDCLVSVFERCGAWKGAKE